MIHIKRIPHYDIAPVVLKMAEQIGSIQRELDDAENLDASGMQKKLTLIQNSLDDIREWVVDLYGD